MVSHKREEREIVQIKPTNKSDKNMLQDNPDSQLGVSLNVRLAEHFHITTSDLKLLHSQLKYHILVVSIISYALRKRT